MKNLKTDTHYYFLTNFLSNFQHIPKGIVYNGLTFYTTEHLFMYRKAEHFKDTESMDLIYNAKTAQESKDYGRAVKGYNDNSWFKVREQVMYEANYLKYTTDEDLKKKLLDTGDLILVESNLKDKHWSCGLSVDDPLIYDENNWTGQNLLGKILMKIREEIKSDLIKQAHDLIDELELTIIYMFVSANIIK